MTHDSSWVRTSCTAWAGVLAAALALGGCGGESFTQVPRAIPGISYLYERVVGTAADDLWANGQSNIEAPSHWDGSKWSVIAAPLADGTIFYWGAAGPGQVWLGGSTGLHQLKRDGTSAKIADLPPGAEHLISFGSFAEGVYLTERRSESPQTQLWRFENGAWEQLPPVPGHGEGMRVFGRNEAWVGLIDAGGMPRMRVARFDGTAWKEFDAPFQGWFVNRMMPAGDLRVVMIRASLVEWGPGSQGTGSAVSSRDPAILAVFDGTAWTEREVPTSDAYMESPEDAWQNVGAIGMTDGQVGILSVRTRFVDEHYDIKRELFLEPWTKDKAGPPRKLGLISSGCDSFCNDIRRNYGQEAPIVQLEDGSVAVVLEQIFVGQP